MTPPPEPPLIVQVQDLSYAFGEGESRKQVLFDNHLDLASGELVMIMSALRALLALSL